MKSPTADASAGAELGYQPPLDGLRAVAVLAVILYHDDYRWARGGFLGVDAFFVLSGFLITTLLLSEYRRGQSIALVAFWGRRLRRLLPALLLVLLAVAAYSAAVVPTIQLARARGDAISSLFYFTNWRFVASGASYFAVFSTPSPVRHLWSLAIEEQFYLVWPLVVIACLHVARGRVRVLLSVSIGGVVASALVMAALYRSGDPSRSYYGTDARIHTILVGAALALVLAIRPPQTPRARRAVRVVGIVAATGVVWMMYAVSGLSPFYYRGGSLLFALAVAATIAAVILPGRSYLRAGLSLAPLVWVGGISYGLYLWHWPVDVFLTEARVGIAGPALDGVRLAVTFLLAIASYYVVEMPIRRGVVRGRIARGLVPASIALTAMVIVVATAAAVPMPSYLGGGASPVSVRSVDTRSVAVQSSSRQSNAVRSGGPTTKQGVGARTDIGITPCPPPSDREVSESRAAAQSSGAAPPVPPGGPLRVLVVGDSLACSVAVGLEPAAEAALDVRQVAVIGCGVVSDEVWDGEEPFPKSTEHCHDFVTAEEQDAVTQFDPDAVLWVSTWERFNLVDRGLVFETDTTGWRRLLRHRLDSALQLLTRNGAHVFVATVAAPAPTGVLLGERVVSPRFDWRFKPMNEQLAAFVARHRSQATLIDVAGKVCPKGPPCPAHVRSVEPRKLDGVHFDPAGAVWISRWMLPQIFRSSR